MSKKRLNLHEQGYKAGDPMWVSWDKRWDGPMRRELMWEGVYQEERLVTTIGFFSHLRLPFAQSWLRHLYRH